MNVDDRTLELATTAMDFGLSTAEHQALADHLHGCSRCRGDVSGLDDDARRIAARPMRRMAPARAVVLRERVVHSGSGWRPALVLVTVGLLVLLGLAVATAGAWLTRWTGCFEARRRRPRSHCRWSWRGRLDGHRGRDWRGGGRDRQHPRRRIGWVDLDWRKMRSADTPPGDCTAEIKWWPDGLAWPATGAQIDIVPPSGASTESWDPWITDVAAADDGFVATAYSMADGVDGASAWWSPDGRRWECTRSVRAHGRRRSSAVQKDG